MPTAHGDSTALLTDQYALTMLASALADGSALRHCTFEVFARGWVAAATASSPQATTAHAFTLLYDSCGRLRRAGRDAENRTTLLIDTYGITRRIATASEVAGPQLRAVRIDSGDLEELARQAREQPNRREPRACRSWSPVIWTGTRSPRCAPSR